MASLPAEMTLPFGGSIPTPAMLSALRNGVVPPPPVSLGAGPHGHHMPTLPPPATSSVAAAASLAAAMGAGAGGLVNNPSLMSHYYSLMDKLWGAGKAGQDTVNQDPPPPPQISPNNRPPSTSSSAETSHRNNEGKWFLNMIYVFSFVGTFTFKALLHKNLCVYRGKLFSQI